MGAESIAKRWAFERWPDVDRELWTHYTTPGDPFDDPRYGAGLRPATLEKIAKGYRAWLNFLDTRGVLDPEVPPFARLTRKRLQAFACELRKRGNADYTIIGRFSELQLAMKIMAPDEDRSWICRPRGMSIYALLPKTKRVLVVPDSQVLYEWAIELMDAAKQQPTLREQLCSYRDGLMIAMLSARARRIRAMHDVSEGQELVRTAAGYRLEFCSDQIKTQKRDTVSLPKTLTPYIDHYMREVRPTLLGQARHNAMWVRTGGGPLTAKGIQHQVTARTKKRFGTGFGPHRFRHSIATTVSLRLPEAPGVAAGLLGISKDVVENSYNRAKQVEAAIAYDRLIERRRTQMKASS